LMPPCWGGFGRPQRIFMSSRSSSADRMTGASESGKDGRPAGQVARAVTRDAEQRLDDVLVGSDSIECANELGGSHSGRC